MMSDDMMAYCCVGGWLHSAHAQLPFASCCCLHIKKSYFHTLRLPVAYFTR